MNPASPFWRRRVFQLVEIGCILFIVLTLGAMLFYPGGTLTDPSTSGYQFFRNFLSELGLTVTHAGEYNTISLLLFVPALTLAGSGLVLFFIAFPQFFISSRLVRVVSLVGSFVGVAAGICFIGIALTPANLLPEFHIQFVLWAFRAFPIAATVYVAAILLEPRYPNRLAVGLVAFAGLLFVYLLLLTRGPEPDSPSGLVVQATGQKIIAYASVISLWIQSRGAARVAEIEGRAFQD
jgi:hypothetical protein